MLVWNLLRVAKEQWWLGDLSSLVNPIPSFWQSFDDLKSFVYFILRVLHLYFCKIRSMVALYFCIYQSWILVAFLLCVFWLKYSFKWVLLCASGHFSDFIKLFFCCLLVCLIVMTSAPSWSNFNLNHLSVSLLSKDTVFFLLDR